MLSDLFSPSSPPQTSLLESPALEALAQTCCSSPQDPSPRHQPHQSCHRSEGLRAHHGSGRWVRGSASSGFQRLSGESGPDTSWE